jgi:hypothetical protein
MSGYSKLLKTLIVMAVYVAGLFVIPKLVALYGGGGEALEALAVGWTLVNLFLGFGVLVGEI